MKVCTCRLGKNATTGESYTWSDLYKVLNGQLGVGDDVYIPTTLKDDGYALWETGGRQRDKAEARFKDRNVSSGTVIAGSDNQILNAALFNKTNRKANTRQAMVIMKPDFKLYVGKMTIERNVLAPSIKIVCLVYKGIDNEAFPEFEGMHMGHFVVEEIYNNYSSIVGIAPAERLVSKLYTFDVVRPFYLNGWNISNKSLDPINFSAIMENVDRLLNTEKVVVDADADKYIDAVENSIVAMNYNKLSAVFQYIDFENGEMKLIPIRDLDMKNIKDTIHTATSDTSFNIKIDDMKKCYNSNILFNSEDMVMLEVALCHDDKYAIKIDNRKYVFLRTWRG